MQQYALQQYVLENSVIRVYMYINLCITHTEDVQEGIQTFRDILFKNDIRKLTRKNRIKQ